jgi:hypothetical protein
MKAQIRTSGTSSARYTPAVLALDSLQCTVQGHTLLVESDCRGNRQSWAQSFRDEVIQVFLRAMSVKADSGICENVCHLWICDRLITLNWLALWNKMLTSHPPNSTVPPLTNASTWSSSNSVLTKDIMITKKAAPPAKITIVDGGLSDEDETTGFEREAAVTSPSKGKQCVTSAVCTWSHSQLRITN